MRKLPESSCVIENDPRQLIIKKSTFNLQILRSSPNEFSLRARRHPFSFHHPFPSPDDDYSNTTNDHATVERVTGGKLAETAEAFNPGCVEENAEIERGGERAPGPVTLSASRRRQGRVAIPISHQARPRPRLAPASSLPSITKGLMVAPDHSRPPNADNTPEISTKRSQPVDFRGEHSLRSVSLLLSPPPSFSVLVANRLDDGHAVENNARSRCRIIFPSIPHGQSDGARPTVLYRSGFLGRLLLPPEQKFYFRNVLDSLKTLFRNLYSSNFSLVCSSSSEYFCEFFSMFFSLDKSVILRILFLSERIRK